MTDALLEVTALPNLHPALVHFPIALAAVALLFDAILVVKRRWLSADASGAALWALAAAGAGAAYLSGRRAADDAGLLENAAEAALGDHADAAFVALIALSVFAAFRIWLAWRSRGNDRVRLGVLRGLALLGAVAAQGIVAYTADLGGALVFRHGVAVAPHAAEASNLPAPAIFPTRGTGVRAPEYLEDGSLLWRPAAGGGTALGATLEPIGGDEVHVARGAPGSDGISLATTGPALLALPDSWDNARVEVRIDPSGFVGDVGLGARIDGETSGGMFRIATAGGAALVAWRDGREKMLDEVDWVLPAGTVTIALSASGSHWKGFVDGHKVVHGHVSLAPPGRMALVLDGAGTVRVISVRISKLDGGGGPQPGEPTHEY
jgi:uncharacterized membrane protein